MRALQPFPDAKAAAENLKDEKRKISFEGGNPVVFAFPTNVGEGVHSFSPPRQFCDAESAKNVSDLARGAIAIAKSQVAKRQPELLQALDGIEVTNSRATLTVRNPEIC